MEAPGGKRGGSEEMIYGEQQDWSVEERAELDGECQRLGIFTPAMTETPFSDSEFPEIQDAPFVLTVSRSTQPLNRAQRRRAKAKARAMHKKAR